MRALAAGRASALVAMLAFLFVGAPSAAAAPPSAVRVGSAPPHPARSRVVGTLPGSTPIAITVMLRPRDPSALADYAAAVSTPGSGLYRRYLTVAEFRRRFGPTATQIRSVDDSLTAQGLDPGAVSANGLAIPVSSTAGAIAHAFSVSFEQVALAGGRTAFANAQAPQFAASVAAVIQGVAGLSTLTLAKPLGVQVTGGRVGLAPRVVTGGPQPCTTAVDDAQGLGEYTADQIASAYRFSSLYGAGDEGGGQTIALFELEGNFPSDITAYQQCYGTSTTVTYQKVDGGASRPQASNGDGLETELDIENLIGLAPAAAVDVYQAPNTGAGLIDDYTAIISQDKAKVISTSWGSCEANEAGTSMASSEDTLFQEAATQGQSVFAAAGDSGSEDCGTNSLAVDDPASQPYVTGVGGTSMPALGPPPTQSVWNDECADGPCGGGGGISSVWPMPSYQSGAPASLHVINPDSSGSPCGAAAGSYCREVPDVSADADPATGYLIYWDGSWTGIGGTSGAAPLWAAFTALVNASTGCNGNAIGFANPVLYDAAASGYSSDFSDITSGNNDIAGTNGGAFPAGSGYDMASGLGTPIGSTLPAALCPSAASPNTVTVSNPGSQTATVGTPVSLPISASDSDASATLSYSATGLPTGLSIDSSTGVISGTPTTGGSSTVTVTATDSTDASGSASFNWTVAGPPTSTSLSCSPGTVLAGSTTSCTVTVTDAGTGTPVIPTGAVSFGSDAPGAFSATSCSLSNGSCHVSYTPAVDGQPVVTATYAGDGQPSAGTFTVTVPAPPSAATTPPGPPAGTPSPSPVLDPPQEATRVGITGTPKAGDVLSCSAGSWTASPAAFAYQWTRDGTPIVGATSSTYTVQAMDEGTTLACIVDAANAAGVGTPAISAGLNVPVPVVAGCPAATGALAGTKLGLITLGETRTRADRAYARSSNRGSRYEDFFCLTPIGIRAGYPSPKLLASLPARERRGLRGRVIWISTASAFYALAGVRPGARITAAAQALKLGRPFPVGLNTWYIAPAGPATAVLKVRGGIVEEVGIADRKLTQGRTAQRRFLTSFS